MAFYRRDGEIYIPSTWEIRFNLKSVTVGTYKLRLSIASATRTDLEVDPSLHHLKMTSLNSPNLFRFTQRAKTNQLQVYVNQMNAQQLVLQVMNLGADNTVCRHGIHGLYQLFSVDIPSTLLINGDNCMFLKQARGGDALCGVLYDYVRLEAPPTS